ncbi:hypothetical protein C7A12_02310 [Pseudomonas fluorescens]|nr:hypothetical protein C7A12_02310 [Pseudomonas fluorescens]PRW82778.1 hypothetical protein C7A13_02310 [Pseudomonas fluorescens]
MRNAGSKWTRFKKWERACSRIRCVSRHLQCLNRRIREQARSHIWSSEPFNQRKARRSTLPTVVLGSSVVRNSTYFGSLYPVRYSRQ